MVEEEPPRLADRLAEIRSRADPVEVVVAFYELAEPVPDEPSNGMSAGQVAVDIVRYDALGHKGPPDDSHYVMGVDADGDHLWDDWYESEQAARQAIADGHYGVVTERPLDEA